MCWRDARKQVHARVWTALVDRIQHIDMDMATENSSMHDAADETNGTDDQLQLRDDRVDKV